MNIEKFSDNSKCIIREAQNLAIKYNNIELSELHIHMSIIKQNDNLIITILRKLNIDIVNYKSDLEIAINKLQKKDSLTKLYYDRTTQKVFLTAEDISRILLSSNVEPEHVYLALFKIAKITSQNIFEKYNLNYNIILENINKIKSEIKLDGNNVVSEILFLSNFGRNLNKQASNGYLDPVIGRDEEINRMIQILSRRNKNNPVIIGDPGVGKTAIVEGLAQRIVNNDVPDSLKKRIVFSLDMGLLLSGAKFRGEFEERLTKILQIIKNSNSQIILYIDELHTVVGSGNSKGGLDTANILKPFLARGEILTIGSTTYDEYKNHIEKDGALDRRFQKIIINPPSVNQTISILRGIKSKYEMHHGIRISDNAIISCAKLSDRYITDRFLPDKAIDLMDEACSMVRTNMECLPYKIDELKRTILQLEKEKISLEEETDEFSLLRYNEIKNKIFKLELKYKSEYNQWTESKDIVVKLKNIKQKINDVRIQIEIAKRDNDFKKITELKYKKLEKLKIEESTINNSSYYYKIKEEIDKEDVAEIVSKWTSIPLTKLTETKRDKILHLDNILKKKIIGQSEAIETICSAIIRSRSGVLKNYKPIGTFLFIGPTGIGKTYLAKTLASTLFDDKSNLIRLDMSEYMEKHSISKLLGAPPGYVGYDKGGILTEAIRKKPYSVILFDEIEKAHPEIFNILLQVFDEGRLTDNKGRIVDFKNTIIIMTSNLASNYYLNNLENCDSEKEQLNYSTNNIKQNVYTYLKTKLKPEFINRIDDIILFKQLNKNDATRIIELEIKLLNNNLKEKLISVQLHQSCVDYIIENSFSDIYGVRPIKRFIEKTIITQISKMILENKINYNNRIIVKYINNVLTFNII